MKSLLEKLATKIGSTDSSALLNKLKEFGINTFEFSSDYIKVPINKVNNFNKFREELSRVSEFGRSFEVTSENEFIFINLNKWKEEYLREIRQSPSNRFFDIGYAFGKKYREESQSSYKDICSGECKHFEHGANWVANRNILFMPDGQYIVLNNLSHPNNTVSVADVIKYLDLGSSYRQVGDLRFKTDESKLSITCSFSEDEAKSESVAKSIVEERAKSEIPSVLFDGYAEKVSEDDFYHGHPIMDINDP